MNNGNASFRSWIHLCVFCLAILPALARAGNTFTFTANAGGNAYSGAGYIGDDGKVYSTLQNWYVARPGGQVWGTAVEGELHGLGVGVGAPGNYTILVGWGDTTGGTWYTVNFSWDGGKATVVGVATITLQLSVRNNLNRAQTISCTGAPPQALAPLGATTMTFTVTAVVGTLVDVGSSPDVLSWDSNYDPLLINEAGGVVQRSAHVGKASATKHVHVTLVSYATEVVGVIPSLDGASIGRLDAQPSSDGVMPRVTSGDFSMDLSPDNNLTFLAPAGHTAGVKVTLAGEVVSYTVTIDAGRSGQANTSTTTNASDGVTTTTATDPTTGTTTIDHSIPTTPTNTDSSPGGAFGSGGTSSSGGGNTYTNTTNNAGSAAAQDSANSLAGMAEDTKRLRENSDAQRKDYESQLSSDEKAALRNFLAQYSNPDVAAILAVNGVEVNAVRGSGNASAAVASKVGAASLGSVDTPAEPSPGTVQMKISPKKTITVHLNPFSRDGPLGGLVAIAAAFIKRLIAWALVAGFFYQVMKEVRAVCNAAFLTGGYTSQTVDLIKSVNVFGWSVGVPVAGVLRIALISLVVTLVLTLPAAALAAAEGGLPWASLHDIYHQGAPGSGGGGTLAAAIGYADYVIPWNLMLSLPLYYILIHNVLFPIQLFWQMVFKFLP